MSQEGRRKFPDTVRGVVIVVLRVGLIAALAGACWMVYRELPATSSGGDANNLATTSLQIVMHQPDDARPSLDVLVSFYPVDVVAVGHEFFTERRAGIRFGDFLKERMKGRSPVSTRLDKEGHGSVTLAPGNWWLHAMLSGDEQLEWRLPVTIRGPSQTVDLTLQNAYTRSKTF